MFNYKKIEVKQSGFSLVELLVGMLISVFIIGGAISYLINSSKALKGQNSTDLIQENARFAFEFLASTARLSGLNVTKNTQVYNQLDSAANPSPVKGINYRNICSPVPENAAVDGDTSPCTVDGFSYVGNGGNYNSDRVSFDYVTDEGFTCDGTAITGEVSVIQTFWVADIDGDGISSLYCQAHISALSFGTPRTYNAHRVTSANAVPLVDGIDSMQIQYGLDTAPVNNGGVNGIVSTRNADVYVPYSKITAANRRFIQSMKIALLVNSGQVIAEQQTVEKRSVKTYTVLDATYQTPVTDGLLRQVLSTTIFLPNLPLQVL